MESTDELSRLEKRMEELQAESIRLARELEALGAEIRPQARDGSSQPSTAHDDASRE